MPSVEEVIEWLPDKLWDVMAGYLSAIEWIPARTHPESMRAKLSEALVAAVGVVSDE
jgi:hypothetical protein